MQNNCRTVFITMLLLSFAWISACNKHDEPAPVITSFYPTTGTSGDPIRITGQHLGLFTGASFGGTAAASFRVVSDSVIIAQVGAAGSGDVVLTRTGSSVSAPGFSYYTPQQYNFTGVSEYGVTGYPATTPFQGFQKPETCSFTVRKINLVDTPRLMQQGPTLSFIPSFATEPDYVILSGVRLDTFGGPVFLNGYSMKVFTFTTNVPADGAGTSVYAKIVGSQITIPMQMPSMLSSNYITGSGTLINGKITLHIHCEFRGQIKKSDLVSQ